MTKMPKPLELILEGEEDIQSLLHESKRPVAVSLTNFLLWALEYNVDSFIFAEVMVKHPDGVHEVLKMGCKRSDYLEACRKQLNHLIEFEEYELCPKLQEWIDYLEIEEKVKK